MQNNPNTEIREYLELTDREFDAQFNTVGGLSWTPWVGRRFRERTGRKLLIVGESHYAKAHETATIEQNLEREQQNREFTREVVWECPVSACWKNPTLERIAPLLVGTSNCKRMEFWQDVAFYNFVQRMVRYVNPPERPAATDFELGWAAFYEVVRIVQPDLCLFLGSQARLSFWSTMKRLGVGFVDQKRDEKIGRCWGYRAEVVCEARAVPIVFIQHPGKYFSCSAWHEYLYRQFPDLVKSFRTEYGL